MMIWHVAHGSGNIKKAVGYGMKRFLVSAWSAKVKRAFPTPECLDIVRSAGGSWFVDSGMISGLRSKVKDWATKQDTVLGIARRLDATLVSHLDVPMEPWLLKNAGWTGREALERTVANAREFLDADWPRQSKVYVLQGWDLDEYAECIKRFHDIGIPDGGKFGIGSCCMRPSTRGLWPILEYVREETEGHWLHAFGIGDPRKLHRLREIGIDSVDEGNLVHAMAFRPWEAEQLTKRYVGFDA